MKNVCEKAWIFGVCLFVLGKISAQQPPKIVKPNQQVTLVQSRESKKRSVINKIVARVNGENILFSDLAENHINTDPYTLEQAITQKLYLQEAIKRKMVPSNLEIEKYVAQVRSDFERSQGQKLSDTDFECELKKEGFTLKRYRTELARTMATTNLLHAVVRERVFVTRQEVEQHCKEHPEWHEGQYVLATCLVPFDQAKTEEELRTLTKFDWVESGWVKKSDIAENMSFVSSMKKKQVKTIKTEHGFQQVKMLDERPRHLKSIDECYTKVEKQLREPKMVKFEREFQQELRKRASIEYL